MKASVVVILHNIPQRPEVLQMTRECLQTLQATADMDYQQILIDNGSQDGNEGWKALAEFRRGEGDQIVRYDKNESISRCWNGAIGRASEETIICLNNDIVFLKSGWMSLLYESAEGEGVGAAGGKMMSWNGFTFLEGAFIAFRKKAALAIAEEGMVFDEQFLFTCEDADFCHRLQRAGLWLVAAGIEEKGYARHLSHGTLSWTNEEGGINGVSALDVMHEGRRKLCRKWGKEERVDD